ncbi:MAG: chorismate synthase [Ignavibacteriae bacterium HGW-Ignavibacteriae-1]|jgi:chorismate synthase|nr:MAG: chorismate synthase [Ignavibacteriae bacterium HGW-Ignavibacteriae-1]
MNTFGRIFRVSIFGESHGPIVGVMIDGCPPGIALNVDDFKADLDRRKPGITGTTTRIEDDIPNFLSGVFEGKTTGAPLTITFENNQQRSGDYEKNQFIPRPGHSDYTAHIKFKGFNDFRGGGQFSGRLTAALVAAGVVAKKLIGTIKIQARIVEIGGEVNYDEVLNNAIQSGDSLGGIVECVISGVPIGLGEPFFDSVESVISHAVFSIPAIKGIEFGRGFESAKISGSDLNDEIISSDGKTATNNAGGVNGGISNGNDIVFRIAVKPTSSISKTQKTIDIRTGEQTKLITQGRHDACIALRVPPVLEAVAAICIADFVMLNKSY